MGKDKRKVLEIVVPSGCSYAVVSELPRREPGKWIGIHPQPINLMKVNFPTSAEEIILQLDIKNIKWKDLIFDDHRSYFGVLKQNEIFSGDLIKINIGDKVKDPNGYSEKLAKIDRMLVTRKDEVSYGNMGFSFSRKFKYHQPRQMSFGPPPKK